MNQNSSDLDKDSAVPIWPVNKDRIEEFLESRPELQAWAQATGFEAEYAKVLPFPGPDGGLSGVLLCLGEGPDLWAWAAAAQDLSEGDYRIEADPDPKMAPDQATRAALGWALGTYSFDQYRSKPARPLPRLVQPEGADLEAVESLVGAIFMVRDMVNTPAEGMGPARLAEIALEVFEDRGGSGRVIVGQELLDENFPAVHGVGRGSIREPRLIDLRWGDQDAPKLTLVGKGVCFDSGGLNLKNAAGMLDMKDDMGGAAHALGLARLVMEAKLPLHLRVLIPAVENMPSGGSYRPGDVIKTRQGTFVEITNTDAEGRVIMSDALSEGSSEEPKLLINFATLTGAARIALGPQLPAVFSNREDLAGELTAIGAGNGDPVWALPLYQPYKKMLESATADLRNANMDGPMAGAITAALFLEEFVAKGTPWIHLDIPGMVGKPEPGRPKEADAFGLRSVFELIKQRFAG